MPAEGVLRNSFSSLSPDRLLLRGNLQVGSSSLDPSGDDRNQPESPLLRRCGPEIVTV